MKNKYKKDMEFQQLLEKTGISKPVPESFQKKLLKSQKQSEKDILKKVGAYSVFTAIALYINYLLWKGGIKISVGIIKIFMTVSIAASVSTGSYVAVKEIIIPLIEKEIKTEKIKKTEENKQLVPANKDIPSKQEEQKKDEVYIHPASKRIGLIIQLHGDDKNQLKSFIDKTFSSYGKKTGFLAYENSYTNFQKGKFKYLVRFNFLKGTKEIIISGHVYKDGKDVIQKFESKTVDINYKGDFKPLIEDIIKKLVESITQ